MNRTRNIEAIVRSCIDPRTPAIVEVDLWALEEQEVSQVLRNLGYFVARVNEFPIDSKAALLQALSQACGFPDYFGFNWDALLDSLVDFSWQPAKGYMLVYEDPSGLAKPDLKVFLEIIAEAGAMWTRSGIPFKLLIPKGNAE
jgi:hypothetical protein